MNYLHRSLEDIITAAVKQHPAVLLYGCRMYGKHTMLDNISALSRYNVISLRDLAVREAVLNNPDSFASSCRKPVIIYDLQYAPELLPAVYRLNESTAGTASTAVRPGSFILVSTLTPEALIRACNSDFILPDMPCLCLSSLSQAELCGSRQTAFSLVESELRRRSLYRKSVDSRSVLKRICRGSAPFIAGGGSNDRAGFYNQLLSTLAECELRLTLDYCSPVMFYRFIKACASMCGQMLNVSRLAENSGLNQRQAKELLQALADMNIIFLLYPYSDGVLKRLVKTPKLYFHDSGLAAFLLGLKESEPLPDTVNADALFENIAVSELLKAYQGLGVNPPLSYYRNKDAREINLIIAQDDALCPITIVRSASFDSTVCENFPLIDKALLPRSRGAVITFSSELKALPDGTMTVPVWVI